MSRDTYVYRGLGQELRSSPREIDILGDTITGLGAKRVMVICGPNVLHESDVVHRVQEALGPLFVGCFDGVAPHSPVEVVEAARDIARQIQPDTLVSVGGGSAMTVAKGVALLVSTDRDLSDYQIRFEPPDTIVRPKIPLPDITVRTVAVATTMGGAEIGPSGGGFASRDRTEKIIVAGDGSTSPAVVVIDGDALATTPSRVQKSTTIGQLRLAIDSLLSTSSNPLSEAIALHAIASLHGELSTGWRDDPLYLLRMKAACCLASHASKTAGSMAINTAIAHQVGAICDVAHGDANAILLPHTIRFNARAGAEALHLIAGAMGLADHGTRDPVPARVADRIAWLCSKLGIPARLRDVGVAREQLGAIATATMGDRSVRTNPRPVDRADVGEILERAW